MSYFFAHTMVSFYKNLSDNTLIEEKKYPAFIEVYEYMGYHIVITGNHYADDLDDLPVRTAIIENDIYPIFISSKTEDEFLYRLLNSDVDVYDYFEDEYYKVDFDYVKNCYLHERYKDHGYGNLQFWDLEIKLLIDIEIIDNDNLLLDIERDMTGRIKTSNLLQALVRVINVNNGVKDWAMVNRGVVVLKNKYSGRANAKAANNKRGSNHFAWARMVKLRDKVCTQCGATEDLHAHHIKPYKKFPELKYDINNGVTLCAHCHRLHHKLNGR